MNRQAGSAGEDERADFMVTLGLRLPFTVEDVKQAYKTRAKAAHPDGGGTAAAFNTLRDAYERGLEHAEFHASRRRWLSEQVDKYVALQRILELVEQHHGSAELRQLAWLRGSVGEDFAQVTDKLVGIHLCGPQVGDDTIDVLYGERGALQQLTDLNLAGAAVTDKSLDRIRWLSSLAVLDLSGTGVTYRGLTLLRSLESLEWLNIGGTRVNWWGRLRLRRMLPEVEVVTVQS